MNVLFCEKGNVPITNHEEYRLTEVPVAYGKPRAPPGTPEEKNRQNGIETHSTQLSQIETVKGTLQLLTEPRRVAAKFFSQKLSACSDPSRASDGLDIPISWMMHPDRPLLLAPCTHTSRLPGPVACSASLAGAQRVSAHCAWCTCRPDRGQMSAAVMRSAATCSWLSAVAARISGFGAWGLGAALWRRTPKTLLDLNYLLVLLEVDQRHDFTLATNVEKQLNRDYAPRTTLNGQECPQKCLRTGWGHRFCRCTHNVHVEVSANVMNAFRWSVCDEGWTQVLNLETVRSRFAA